MRWLRNLLKPTRGPRDLDSETAARIRSSFENAAQDEEHFPSTIDPRILHVRLLLEYLGDMNGRRGLDLGCGKGRFSRLVKDASPGAQIVALDLAVNMLRAAPRSLHRVSASMLNLPFPDSAFDAAWATESLEHAVLIEKAVAELSRVVKPGGRIYVIDKNREHWGRFKTPDWERWFTPAEMKSLLERHCQKVEARPISYWDDVAPDGLFYCWTAIR